MHVRVTGVLHEMPRDFCKELAVFTILEPMDLSKYKPLRFMAKNGAGGGIWREELAKKSTVKVLEAGIVGSLDYKIIQADKADDLYVWLKDNKYSYSGDEATLDHWGLHREPKGAPMMRGLRHEFAMHLPCKETIESNGLVEVSDGPVVLLLCHVGVAAVVVEICQFWGRRIASVKSAIALSYSFFSE